LMHISVCFTLLFLLISPTISSAEVVFETFLEPNKVVDMGASYRDRLTVLHVKEGERVKTGQLLAEFDSRVLRARLALAKTVAGFHGGIDSAEALVTLRKTKLATLKKIELSGNARPQELDMVRTNLAMAEAQLLAAYNMQILKKAELTVILAQLEEKKLRSPLDGVVLKIYKQEAELVGGSGQEPILILVQLDPLLAVFHFTTATMPSIKVGESVKLSVMETEVEAEVVFISPVIEPQSGTVAVRFRLPNPDGTLVSGSRIIFTVP